MTRTARKVSRLEQAVLLCRSCENPVTDSVVDLGLSPLANSYVPKTRLEEQEVFYPLHPRVCRTCWLVQIPVFEKPEDIFSDYAYFSSFSDSWVKHAKRYTEDVTRRFKLGDQSLVVEVASNDGYLLRHFVDLNITCLGVEPAANVAKVAMKQGIPTEIAFFGRSCARKLVKERGKADLIIGNNVLAQVPDLHDFLAGMQTLLSAHGVITVEFPHWLTTMEKCEFDTIYHEHFSYFSLIALEALLEKQGLAVFDVTELPTHGGSLRVFIKHQRDGMHQKTANVEAIRRKELSAQLNSLSAYQSFASEVRRIKQDLLLKLIECKRQGLKICGYGAPAKGNTLLNYCGIRTDFLDFTVDKNPEKQNKFLPGARIPIFDPQKIREEKPDRILILPWNLKEEIMKQCDFARQWGAKFIVPIPKVLEL